MNRLNSTVAPVALFALGLGGLVGIGFGVLALFGKDGSLIVFGTFGVCVLIFCGAAWLEWLLDSYESGFGGRLLKALLFIIILFGTPVAAFFLYLALWGIIPAFIAAGGSLLLAVRMVIPVMSERWRV